MLSLPTLEALPETLPLEGAIAIELQEGVPIFRASQVIQQRIEALLERQQAGVLEKSEELELDAYEEMDDYISFVNRTIRNLAEQAIPKVG